MSAHGESRELADRADPALGSSKTPLQPPAAARPPASISTATQLDRSSASKGNNNGGSISLPCRAAIRPEGGCRSRRRHHGVRDRHRLQPTGGGKQRSPADFVLTGEKSTR